MKNLIKISRLLFFLSPLLLVSSCMMMPFGQMGMHDEANLNHRIDPVCGHTVSDNPIVYEFNDTQYFFDSPDCLSKFQENPNKYAHQPQNAHHHGGWFLGGLGTGILMTAMMALMLF